MAFSTIFSQTGEVLRMPGEFLVFSRPKCQFEVSVNNGGSFKGEGSIIVSSFRLILVNFYPKTSSQWKGLDLPMPYIFDTKFKKPFFGKPRMTGYCKNIALLLPGTLQFTVYFVEGSMDLFEEIFSELSGMVQSQKLAAGPNLVYQKALATGQYNINEVKVKAEKDDLIRVFEKQPPYYSPPNLLTELMEQTIPGITAFGVSMGIPHPEFVYIPPVASVPPTVPPITEIPAVVPSVEPQGLYPELSGEALGNPIENTCTFCKFTGTENSMKKLLCGHWIHDMCLIEYMGQVMEKGGKLADIKCGICAQPIEYGILKEVDEDTAEQLFIKSTQDNY